MIALDLGDHACKVANDLDGSGLDKLRILLLCYIEWMYGEAGIGGITSDINALRPDDRITVVSRRDKIDRALVDLIELGIRDGSRSEEHTSELQSLMRISYAVFC